MKIQIKAKDQKDNIKARLLEKEVKNWLEKTENSKMMEEYMKLANDVIFYKAKWGIPVELVIGELEERKGRCYGKGIVDSLMG